MRPFSLVMVMAFLEPVLLSCAETFKMPFASRSKLTSICGTPRGAGGMPESSNVPSRWLSRVIARSPSYTWMVTPVWLSEYVEKTCCFATGIVVLRGTSVVITPPAVSSPRDRGATSSNSRSFTALPSPAWPVRMAACTAAPYATLSSGLMLLFRALPAKKSLSMVWILGMRVEPPTSTTSSTPALSALASTSARSTGSMTFRNRSALSSSNLARVMLV